MIFPVVKDNYVSETILVESFIDAKPISDYITTKHVMNPLIAKNGMNILYRMIFYENFVHGDCHAGNILVQVKKGIPIQPSLRERLENYIAFDLVPAIMSLASKNKAVSNKQFVNDGSYDIKLAFIDAGMVTSLSEKDQYNFFQLAWSIINRDALTCSKVIKGLTVKEIQAGVLESLDNELNSLFETINKVAIPDINVGTTIMSILNISAVHGIKFEGNLGVLLTQLITLEGIARGLDPDINIIGSAMPFLINRQIKNSFQN